MSPPLYGGGDICGTTDRTKDRTKNRSCGDAKFFLIFCRKKNKEQTQKASGPTVADWQCEGVEKIRR